MTVLYVDLENGNDNYAGSSFSLLAQGTNGRISGSTFSSANANFPNDDTLINHYLSIFNGTIYAVYQITAWLSSTSLTIAAITGGTALANQTVDRQYYIGGRWKTITSGVTAARIAPYDEVRVMASPDPTLMGVRAFWTGGPKQPRVSNPALSNTTPIVATVANHGLTTGDTVVIYGVTGNTAANGTWEITVLSSSTFELNGSAGNGTTGGTRYMQPVTRRRVLLDSAVTANIACTGKETSVAWTGATADVTSSTSNNSKEHATATVITIGAGFTSGKAAYYTLPSTLDLSGYQQVSFWFRLSLGTHSATNYTLRLCSDTIGDTTVHTIPISQNNGTWQPITVDLMTNLSNQIRSVAIYVASDLGAVTLNFDNIIACKASSSPDSLTLSSLISYDLPDIIYYPIQSINGTRVMLDSHPGASLSFTDPPTLQFTTYVTYWYKLETIKLPAASSSASVMTVNESGPLTFSFGWDRDSMTSIASNGLGRTWVDGVYGWGTGLSIASRNNIQIENLSLVRYSTGLNVSGNGNYCDSIESIGNTSTGVNISGSNNYLGASSLSHNGVYGLLASCNRSTLGVIRADGNGINGSGFGIYLNAASHNIFPSIGSVSGNHDRNIMFVTGSTNNTFRSIQNLNNCRGDTNSCGALFELNTANNIIYAQNVNGNAVYAFYVAIGSWNNYIIGGSSTGSGTASVYSTGASSFYLKKFAMAEAVETLLASGANGYDARIFSHNHDNTADNHKIFTDGGLITSDTATRYTESGISWKLQPTSTSRDSFYPLILSLAKVAVAANSLVTIKAWMRRDNSGLTMRLVCKGGQIAGVANDVTASVTSTNAWEEETITFTPTETGVVAITAEAWGGTTFSGWVDGMTISQA